MAPKAAPARSRSKSPAKPAAPAAGKKASAPAGSSAVAKASAPAAKKSAATPSTDKATAATAPSGPSTTATSSPAARALLLQAVARAFQCRLDLGGSHKRHLKAVLAEQSQQRGAAFAAHQRKQQAADKKAEMTAKERLEAKMKLQNDLSLAAFDGDMAALKKLLQQGANPAKRDEEGNYALGEAAVNGQVDAIKALVAAGADMNSKGAFARTPLWRAAFNSHAAAAKTLLELGADPRVSAQGQLPVELASGEAKGIIASWDVTKTDALVKAFETKRAAAEAAEAKARAAETSQQQNLVNAARDKFKSAQLAARAARAALESRIAEYDLCFVEGKGEKAKESLTGIIKDAEKAAEAADEVLAAASDAYLAARRDANAALAEGEYAPSDDDSIITVSRLEVGQLVTPGWAAKAAAKNTNATPAAPGAVKTYPFLIDVAGTSATFFRYRNVNFIDAFSPRDLTPEKVRVALLGAMRYGKGLVVDLRDVPMLDFVVDAFDKVRAGLWNALLDGKATEEAYYTSLVKAEDGPEYAKDRWRTTVTANFVFLALTSAFFVDDEVWQRFHLFRVDYDD